MTPPIKAIHVHVIVLVDLNEFPQSLVQHSHSRHQETASNLLRINLKGKMYNGAI